MKILHFIDSLGHGGAENLMVNTTLSLPQYEHLVVYLTGPDDLRERLGAIPTIRLNKSPKAGFAAIVLRLRRILRDEGVSIIHAHSYWTNILARVAAPRSVQVINHYHFADYDTMKGTISVRRMVWLDKLTRRRRHRLLCVSEYVTTVVRRESGFTENIQTLLNFIGDKFYEGKVKAEAWAPGTILKLVAFGSPKWEKNYGLLIEAFATLRELPVSLDVWGGGPMLHELQDAARNLPQLNFRGESSAIHEILPHYHAYVMCSVSEACPLSPIEAMSAGLPLILTNIPALKEFAADVATFFEPTDAQGFANILRGVLAGDLELRADLPAYQTILQRYSKTHFIQRLDTIYKDASH